MTSPRPNLSADPRDHDPARYEPPSKRDYAHLWLEIIHRQMRGEWPADTPPPSDGQLPLKEAPE